MADPSVVRWNARDGRREKRKKHERCESEHLIGLGQFIPIALLLAL
jgi:hypothetical protein